ncbi:MAG TPA: hypothetical protein VHZ33_35510 [Trebonia sp.]|jgi:hypothetical protein|nr:hypothetical protein [Trebonia sp.]
MVNDVYLLVMHDPYDEPGAPVPVNGVIVHAATLLHPELPQPDAGRIYRCLTEFPGRTPHCLIPLSTLNYELDDGRLWPQVAGDWRAAMRALVALTRTPGRCESKPLAFPEIEAALLATGPFAPVPPGLGIPERHELLAMLAEDLPRHPLWPGENLVRPPSRPAVMPYQPHGT